MQLKPQCRSFLSLPPLLPFLSVSFLSFYAPLSLASAHTRHATHTHTASRVCAAVGECVGPVIHFTPHWSETCDCGSGLCLFLTPWESTGVRGHMQEKHTHIYSCTCTRTNTTVTSSYFFSFSFFFFEQNKVEEAAEIFKQQELHQQHTGGYFKDKDIPERFTGFPLNMLNNADSTESWSLHFNYWLNKKLNCYAAASLCMFTWIWP